MALRSKVWPALVRSSLNLSPVESPAERIQFSYRPQRLRRRLSLATAATCRSLRHHLRRPICNSAASDIFCVAGAITAITGSLVATFGIFPKNQARIRLYLECVGCAMVIVGVLIVFVSQKMRSRGDLARARCEDQLSLESRTVALGRLAAFQQRKFDTFQLDSSARDIVAVVPAVASNRPLVSRDEAERVELVQLGGSSGARASMGDLATKPSPLKWEASAWCPDGDSSYGEGHQAALEAALSLVLTVSTLAGFRPDHAAHHHCCLHHAVQHKLKARRWLSRFRHRVVAGTTSSTLDTTVAETTLALTAPAVGHNQLQVATI